MGEVFRDMAEAGQHLAVQDTTIAKPHLAEHRKDKAPNIEEFCIVWKQGHKAVIKSKFKETLEICAVQNYETMDKIISILASPLQDQLRRWVKFTVGMDSFQIHGVHEMTLSQCTHFWQHWLDRVVSFYELIMANVPARHFDSQLQDALAGIQPRNDTNLNNLFWPVKGRDFQGDYPVKDAKRGDELLPWVTDKQYKEIYQRLKAKHSFDPMNKQESRNFIKHNIPAVRSVLSHVA